MSTLETFVYGSRQVRTIIVDGEVWFVGKDVCDSLGIENQRNAFARLDDDERNTVHLADGIRGNPNKVIVNEAGLYSLILRSDKPEAKAFKRWVTHEVLPQIRRTGQFRQVEVEHALPSSFADALRQLAASVEKQEQLEAKIVADAPKVEAFDRWMDADGYYPMHAVAKILGVGRNTLYSMLRKAGVIMPVGTAPYQRYAHHFVLIPGVRRDGVAYETTKVRPTGIPFIANKLGLVVREKGTHKTRTPSGEQDMTIINEPGLEVVS